MMQKILISLLTGLALFGLPAWSQAQTTITTTTITEAVTSTATSKTFVVNSATGISAGVSLLIDNDVCRVAASYSTGTSIPVLCTARPTTHNDNAAVLIFPQAATRTRAPTGSCTRGSGDANYAVVLVGGTGQTATCRNSTWYVTSANGEGGTRSGNPPQTDGA